MADQQQAAAIGLKLAFQPFDGRQVQVVGRLVEQQDVGGRDQGAAQGRAPRLPAGQGPRAAVAGKAEAVQHGIDPVQGILIVGRQALRDEVVDGRVAVERRLLRQIRDPRAGLEKAFAVVGQDLPGQQFHEGGFAAAVASNQAHLFAPRDAEIDFLEHRQTAESDRGAHQRDQGRSRCHDWML